MRIYIIGASASGKTTYAAKVAKKYSLKHYNSDYLRFVQIKNTRGRRLRNVKGYRRIIDQISKSDNWVFEGRQAIPELLHSADHIIWLKVGLFTALFRQWKRYFTNRQQRQEYSFMDNLRLSKMIIVSQYLGRYDPSKFHDPDYTHIKKLESLLSQYGEKLIVASDGKSITKL